MADEYFQAGVCGESWWINSTKNIFGSSSPSASSFYDPIGQYFAWPNEFLDMKNRSSDNYSSSDDSMVLQELSKNHNLSMNSSIQILGIGTSSSPSSASPDWNQSFQEDLNSNLNCQQQNGVDCHKLKRNFSCITEDNSSSNSFIKPIMNQEFTCYSDLLQTLFDNDPQEPQQFVFANNQPINYASSTNFGQNLNDLAPSLPTPLLKPSLAKHPKSNIEEIRESKSSSVTKHISTNDEPAYKRPRIETPSPLPTFKVRKEKLGDWITALQQLVSPFGKTDTASVLQEAIEYINFLHDQVNVLRTQYMKNISTPQHQQVKEQGLKQGLRSKGLCLVPISSTFPVAAETTFWTPTLGGTFT